MTLLRDLSIQRYSVSVVERQQVGGERMKILYASEMGGAKAKEEKEAHGDGWEDEKESKRGRWCQ